MQVVHDESILVDFYKISFLISARCSWLVPYIPTSGSISIEIDSFSRLTRKSELVYHSFLTFFWKCPRMDGATFFSISEVNVIRTFCQHDASSFIEEHLFFFISEVDVIRPYLPARCV